MGAQQYRNTYNAYQAIIRDGHIFWMVRVSNQEILTNHTRYMCRRGMTRNFLN